jgi:mono/diheme cytochrome c family protein
MRERAMKKTLAGLVTAALLLAFVFVLAAEVVAPALRKTTSLPAPQPTTPDAALVQRGAYLARLGNCAQCHTPRGGPAYSGGEALQTPFGRVYPGNLTPHPTAGIGPWSAADFWRALHQGVGPDGRVLNPAFPYTSYTRISPADSDALFAYLRTLPASDAAAKPHDLPWPLGTQTALTAWRMLHFREADRLESASRDAAPSAQRGADLVQGLGHCAECHTPRNRLGGLRPSGAWGGAVMPDGRWYAPALNDTAEGGLSDWEAADIATLLTQGQHRQAYVAGPMAEVVRNSTQYLQPDDALSMALYLKTLNQGAPAAQRPAAGATHENAAGAKVYENYCAQCHGKSGEGVDNVYPALAGNRAVVMNNTNNLVLILLRGAYGPSTTGKPQPFGMPPYQFTLSSLEVANVLSFIRNRWGNYAPPVTEFDIDKIRNASHR